MEQQLITVPEVAAMLGVHRTTVTRWAARGDLEAAYRMPGQKGAFLFEKDQIAALAAEKAADNAL